MPSPPLRLLLAALAALLLTACGAIVVPSEETADAADSVEDTTTRDATAPDVSDPADAADATGTDGAVAPVSFYAEVRPLLQAPTERGGIGCHPCHVDNASAGGGAGGLYLGDYGPGLWETLVNRPTSDSAHPSLVHATGAPGESLLLTSLLATATSEDHPLKPFQSSDDPRYQVIARWIGEGAINDSPRTVSFIDDVRPLIQSPSSDGGIGCVSCHLADVGPGTAQGGLYFGGTAADLYQVLTRKTPKDNGQTGESFLINKEGYPERSLLLTSILTGDPEAHPIKPLADTDDPRYRAILTWIREGFQFDG